MTGRDKETPIIFNNKELGIKDVRASLDEFFEAQKISREQEQELRGWFKREYKRLIDRKKWQTGEKAELAFHATVLSSVLGELKSKVERVKVDEERGEARLNPSLETKASIRKKLDSALSRIRETEDGRKHIVVLVSIDLDDFKAVNDNFSHQAGDEVLKKEGRALEAAIRPTDWGAHYSGDEFGILMEMDFSEGTSMKDIRAKVKKEILPRIIQAMQKPKDREGKTIDIRPDGKNQELSVGFKVIEAKDKGEFEDFSKDADVASEFSKILRIIKENAGRKMESAERIIDFSEVIEMVKIYTQEERTIAKAIRDMKRTLGELERAVPGLHEVDTKAEALRFIKELIERTKINGGGNGDESRVGGGEEKNEKGNV